MTKFKNKFLLIVLVLFLLIPLISLLNQGLPYTHDGRDHVARIANFYQSLSEGNIIPRWAGNLNWGYGHPILMFLYPLPSYFASFFHLIGFNFVDSTKIIFALGFFLSGIFMYLWLSQFLKKDASVFGAVLYVYAPYRFVDLYVRGAIGENFAFIWLPLVLYFTYKLFKKENYIYSIFLGISFAFLVLSHNALSLIFLPFIIFYGIFLWSKLKFKKSYIVKLGFSIILGFTLSSFFWVPAFFEGKYTLRNVLTSGTYVNRFVDFKSLIYGPWSYGQSGEFTLQLGLIHWLAIVFSLIIVFYSFKKRKDNYYLFLGGLVYSLVAIFMMLKESDFIWRNIMVLQNFQFPWRLLAITVFSTSLLGALSVSLLKGKLRKIIIPLLLIIIFLLSLNYMKPKGYLIKPESFYTSVFESTTDTGESSPIWSVRFMEKRPKAHLEVIDGNADILELKRTTTEHVYKIDARTNTLFMENTIYFPGWKITADNKPIDVEFQNMTYRGIMTFHLDKGSYNVRVVYEDTKLRKVSNLISVISFLAIVVLFSIKLRKFT